jgi:hypothetical protein
MREDSGCPRENEQRTERLIAHTCNRVFTVKLFV